ncbi:uncharacterized protein PHACADRAFT_91812, partial [Phanerochaete carnosa HHB-10118-sp]
FLVRGSKGRTPTPSEHPSRPSFGALQQKKVALAAEAPLNHHTAKIRANDYKCMLTGYPDYHFLDPSVTPQFESDTHLSHIIPRSLNQGISSTRTKARSSAYSATVWTILERYANISFTELNGPGLHRLENVLTLDSRLHNKFDELNLWLEAVPDSEHAYSVRCYPVGDPRIQNPVRFTTPDTQEYPFPDPRYLKLHAACARVYHLSGAAEYIESFQREIEDTMVLADNGSSAEMLAFALQPYEDVTVH